MAEEGAADYAIRNGLTIDGTRFQPWKNPVDDPQIMTTIADPACDHGETLPECYFKPIVPMTALPFTQEDMILINRSVKTCEGQELEALVSRATNPRRIRGLKFEIPVLRSHHRMDCRGLKADVQKFLRTPFPNHNLPLEPVSVEKDEDLAFPQSAIDRDLEIMESLEEDMMVCDQQTVELISKSMQTAWTDTDRMIMIDSLLAYRGVSFTIFVVAVLLAVLQCSFAGPVLSLILVSQLTVSRPLTPPLPFANDSTDEPYVPDGKTSQVPVFSDPSSRLSDDLRHAEEEIFKEGTLWDDMVEYQPSSPPLTDLDVVGMPQVEQSSETKFRARDLKFELDIFPLETHVVMNPDLTIGKDLVDNNQEDLTADAKVPDSKLEGMFRGMDVTLTQTIEQEKLDMLDATARTPVPVMDFKTTAPEWEEHQKSAMEIFRWILEDSKIQKHMPTWPLDTKADKKLKWSPVAKVQKDFVHETLEGNDELFEEYLSVREVPTSADYTGKRSGLALLRFQDDEDEDLLAMPETKRGSQHDELSVILRKRKALLDEEAAVEKPAEKLSKVSQSGGAGLRVPRPSTGSPVPLFIQNEADAIKELLESFLHLKGHKNKQNSASPYFGPPHNSATQPAKTSDAGKGRNVDDFGHMHPPPKLTQPYVPDVPRLDVPPRVIASIALSKTIWVGLEKMLPGIVLLERDYNAYNTTIAVPWNDKQNEIKSSLGDEADIIVGPATGIVLTTMTRVRQKSMAVQGKSLFCTRIERVARRYERLVVLISEGSNRESVGPLDAKGLAEFKGFAAGLNTDISVLYVAGGQESLAVWTAAMIAKHAHDALPIQDLLVSEETWWELFLRRAGMNTSAAQVVLSLLKKQEQREGQEQRDEPAAGVDLPSRAILRFMQMNLEQRVAMFAGPLGGQRALQRVSKMLDTPWK